MRNRVTEPDVEILARRIDAVMREIEQAKQERAAADLRNAFVRMTAAQTARRRERRSNRSR